MAEHKMVNTEVLEDKLEKVADEIRVLSGTTERMSITDMTRNINQINGKIDEQANIIEQIIVALKRTTDITFQSEEEEGETSE